MYLSYGAQGGIWNHWAMLGPWGPVYCIVGEVFWKVYPNMHSLLKAVHMTDLPWSSFFPLLVTKKVNFDQIFHAISFNKSTGAEDKLPRQASCTPGSWHGESFSKSILRLILSNLWTADDCFWKLQVDRDSQRTVKRWTKSIFRARLGRNLWDVQWWMNLTSVLGNALTEQSLKKQQNRQYKLLLRANHLTPF